MSRYQGTNDLLNYMFGTTGGTVSSVDGTISPSDMQLLQNCLDWAESHINAYTRRQFAGTAGTVYYNRWSQGLVRSNALYLNEDVVSLVAITNGDGQAIPMGSVWLEPRNSGPPYRIVRFHSQYVYIWNTDSDVALSGTFGFSIVAPDAIKAATLEYAAHLFRSKDIGPLDVAGSPEMGEVKFPKGMPESVKIKLSPFRSRSGGVI
jgi:hypothetical protein